MPVHNWQMGYDELKCAREEDSNSKVCRWYLSILQAKGRVIPNLIEPYDH